MSATTSSRCSPICSTGCTCTSRSSGRCTASIRCSNCARLHERARLMSDDAFHREIAGILTNLRDAHTAYIAPSPLAGAAARLPFLVEQFGPDTAPRFIVSKVIRQLVPDTQFSEGAELIEWNGVPIADAVRRRGESERGGRPDSAMARALDSLTFRPLGIGPPPDERWVIVGYRRHDDSALREHRFEWRFIDPGLRPTPPTRRLRRLRRWRSIRIAPWCARQEAVVQRRAVADRAAATEWPPQASALPATVGSPVSSKTTCRPASCRSPGATTAISASGASSLSDDDGFIAEVDATARRTAAGRVDHRSARQPGWPDLGCRTPAAAVHTDARSRRHGSRSSPPT